MDTTKFQWYNNNCRKSTTQCTPANIAACKLLNSRVLRFYRLMQDLPAHTEARCWRRYGGKYERRLFMPYYRTCTHCGANLDPGELCECEIFLKVVHDPTGRGNLLNRLNELELLDSFLRVERAAETSTRATNSL